MDIPKAVDIPEVGVMADGINFAGAMAMAIAMAMVGAMAMAMAMAGALTPIL
jgi:hypothetical protein